MRFIRFKLTTALILLVLLASRTYAHNQIAPNCRPIDIEHQFLLASRWDWLDSDTVVFSVYNPGSTNRTPIWYRYHPSSDQLEKLDSDPTLLIRVPDNVAQLADLQPGENPTVVSLSPSENYFIYRRIGPEGSNYWFGDAQTGAQFDLGIEVPPTATSIHTLWDTDERHAVLYDKMWPDNVVPAQFITIDGQSVKVEELADVVEQTGDGYMFRHSGSHLAGFSPSGEYSLIAPDFEGLTWVVNLKTNELTKLDFYVQGDRRAVWSNPNTFIALAYSLGVIEYDLPTQRMLTIAPPDAIGLDTLGYASLSPDGRFFASTRALGRQNSMPIQGFTVCSTGL